MPIITASLCKQFWDKRLTVTPGSPDSDREVPLRLAWLVWAPADQPCERRRDAAIEILSDKAFQVGAKNGRNIQKIKDAFGRDLKQARA